MDSKIIRTRFAPSPTGMLHIGGLRTAVYNYILSHKYNGNFILRIEDTDQKRFVPQAEKYIINSLKWLGIMPNEGIINGGPYGPYRQSERKEIYKEFVNKLIEADNAYYAFDSAEELEAMHKKLESAKIPNPQYNAISREWMKNSLTLSRTEVENRINDGDKFVIRFKMPKEGFVRFHDEVRGWVKVDVSTLDDKILLKSDGVATYHLANVVDDYLMKITHVIRGEEWLPSAPLHVLMYKAFGWEEFMPTFVHLPLLLKPVGQGKLSKRDAEEQGFPIFPLSWKDPNTGKEVLGFREKGYLPEALLNFLVLMGWNPGNNQEIFSLKELIENFSLERLGKSGARFNIKKAEWFNKQYLGRKPNDFFIPFITEHVREDNREKLDNICEIVKERAVFISDIWEFSKTFFKAPKELEQNEKFINATSLTFVQDFLQEIEKISFTHDEVHNFVNVLLENKNLKYKDVMPLFRIALFGSSNGPDVIKSMIIIGKDESLKRIKTLLQKYES
ncbi:MAG: glutamate--tRNA ligase [Cytophagales bacterium]|jgi:glutamyl-tRNA synthetase|nr:glutamate--tRNA ligase [Cytophagales bacterium]